MNLADFIKAVVSTRMQQRTKDAARLVLVDGLKIVDAAKQMEMSPQQLGEAVARVEAAHMKTRGTPEGWAAVTVIVPPDRVEAVREIERQAMRSAGLTVD